MRQVKVHCLNPPSARAAPGEWVDAVEINDLARKYVNVTEKLTRKPKSQRGWTTISWLLLQAPHLENLPETPPIKQDPR